MNILRFAFYIIDKIEEYKLYIFRRFTSPVQYAFKKYCLGMSFCKICR